jgi:hypothetical protein
VFQQVSQLFSENRTEGTNRLVVIPTIGPLVLFSALMLYVVVLPKKIPSSGRRSGQLEDICGDCSRWLLIQGEVCEQSFLSASERGKLHARPINEGAA